MRFWSEPVNIPIMIQGRVLALQYMCTVYSYRHYRGIAY